MPKVKIKFPTAELLDAIAHDIETLAGPAIDETWLDEMLEARESYFNELCATQIALHRGLASAWSRHHARVFRSFAGDSLIMPIGFHADALQRELDFVTATAITELRRSRQDFNDVLLRHERGDLCVKPVAFRFAIV